MQKYAQASTVPLFRLSEGPLRNVNVTVPDVVGVQVNGDELPAVTVRPGEVVGGFDVAPVCAATAASRPAITESAAIRIVNVATERFVYTKCAAKLRRESRIESRRAVEPNIRRWQGRRCESYV